MNSAGHLIFLIKSIKFFSIFFFHKRQANQSKFDNKDRMPPEPQNLSKGTFLVTTRFPKKCLHCIFGQIPPTHKKIQRRLPQTVSPPSSSFLSPQFLWTPSHSLSPHSSVTLLVPNTWSSTSSSLSIKEIKNKPHHQEERIKSHLPCPFSSRKAQKKTKCQQRCSDTRALGTRMRARRLIWRQGMERLCTQV